MDCTNRKNGRFRGLSSQRTTYSCSSVAVMADSLPSTFRDGTLKTVNPREYPMYFRNTRLA